MRIGNVGIFVKDLAGARKFFEDYFGATLLKTYNEEETTTTPTSCSWMRVHGSS